MIPPSLKIRRCQSQKQTSPVLNSATSETEESETNMSETKGSKSVSEDEEEKEKVRGENNNSENFHRKVDLVTSYDRDYIWGLVHDQLRQVGLSQVASDYAMIHFDHRYKYALENMRFADRAETIAEYVFNGVLSEWTKVQRLNELKGGE